ncbi:MAG: glycosyl hydrolase 53 family protein [Ferruginibacter sp.]
MQKRLFGKTMTILLFSGLLSFFVCCGKTSGNNGGTPPPTPPKDTIAFAKGADIGWLSQMEAEGKKFYDNNGNEKDCIELLKSKGINSIRLRVWVNPTNGWCGAEDVVKQAVRAKNKGMRIMIDFHYSDWWADPGKQNKPAAWTDLSFTNLTIVLAAHTKEVLQQLATAGVTPEWVQVGNETNDGMLWEDGRASKHMDQFAALVKAGYNAVKEVNSKIKVLVHISNGWDNNLFRWIFDGLKTNGASCDVIAMSLYPSTSDWQQKNNQCLANMNDMIARYGKEVMISEVGMPWDSPDISKQFLQDIINKTRSIPGNKGLGVFYWEPESYGNWQGYTLGAFDNSGKPTTAMDAFSN